MGCVASPPLLKERKREFREPSPLLALAFLFKKESDASQTSAGPSPYSPWVPQAALSLGNECSQEGEGREEAETAYPPSSQGVADPFRTEWRASGFLPAEAGGNPPPLMDIQPCEDMPLCFLKE